MQVLIVHVFGQFRHLENWLHSVTVSPSVKVVWNRHELITPEVRILCKVVSGAEDMNQLRGIRPHMIIEEDSFRAGRFYDEWRAFKAHLLSC